MLRRLAMLLALIPAAVRAEPPGDALPAGAVARLGDYRFYQGGPIDVLAVSPDGKRVVTSGALRSGNDGEDNWGLLVWDAATGEALPTFSRPGERPCSLAFSRDGKAVAAGSYGRITVWDAATMRQRLTLPCDGRVDAVTFSPDGRQLIATVEETNATWFNLDTGKPSRRRDPWPNGQPKLRDGQPAEEIGAIAVSPDQSVIAFAITVAKPIQGKPGSYVWEAGPIRFVDAATGKVAREVTSDRRYQLLAYSPGGRTLAAGDLYTLRILNAADGKERFDLTEIPGTPTKVVFSPDDQSVAVVCCERFLQVRDVATGKIVWRREHELGDDRTGVRPRTAADVIAYFPDGKTLAFAPNAWLRQFDARTRAERTADKGHRSHVEAVRYANGGRTILTGAGNQFGVWDFATRGLTRLAEPNLPDVPPNGDVIRSEDGSLFCIPDEKGALNLWNGLTGKILRRLEIEAHSMRAGAFSPDGRILVLSTATINNDHPLDVFDVRTGKSSRRIITSACFDITFSLDGARIAYLTDAMELCVMDVATGRELLRVPKVSEFHLESRTAAVLSADGRTVAVHTSEEAEDGLTGHRVRVFAVSSGVEMFQKRLPRVVHADDHGFACEALSSDGRLVAIAFAGETGIRVYETASGSLYHCFDGHRARVLSAAFSPDGRTLATGGQDGVALIWDLRFPLRTKAKRAADLWADLASADAARAWAAVHALAEAPDAVRFLRERVTPARAVPPEQVARLIDARSAPVFADRERAGRDLAALGDAAKPGLEQALKGPLAAEGRKRVQALLDELRGPVLTGERLRQWRAVAVLERVGTPDAAALLGELAGGWGESRLTRDAADAKARLAERRP